MDKKHGLRGIWAAALTAFDESGALDVDATLWHWRWLLGSGGCAGVVPFGTTGEGPSLSNEERCLLLEAALGAGIERERLWPGTGGASLTDVISLTRRVRALGLSGVLILPPFFYASDEAGLLAWYSAVFSALEDGGEGGDNDFGIMLYNIPKLSRCTITLGLVSSLVERFPHRLAGVKDSDGDWENMHALTGTFPALSIMCGDERLLLAHSRAGGAGGIMARGCVAGLWLARLFAAGSGGGGDGEAQQDFLNRLRATMTPYGTIPAIKYLTARHPEALGCWWPRAPLLPLDEERGAVLCGEIAGLGREGEEVLAQFGDI